MLPPLMGLSPATPFSSSPYSSLGDWLLTGTLDRDTQILTQALTHELSTPSLSASPPPGQALIGASHEQRFDRSASSLHVLRALQQQQKQQHQQQSQAAVGAPMTTVSCGGGGGRGSQNALHHVEHSSLQMGSPPSSNSHSPLSTSNPESPYDNVSTISTSSSHMSMPIDGLLAHMKHNASLHHDLQAGLFDGRMITQNDNTNSKSFQSSRAASMALSAEAAQGVGGNKVSKRRSRACSRNPITVLSADVSNFRAMVQQLTGIPSTPYMQSFANSALVKPQATKISYTNSESLPTLDTSASFLGPKPAPATSMKDPLEGFSFAQGNHQLFSGSLPSVGKSKLEGYNLGSVRQSSAPYNAKQSMLGGQHNVPTSSSTLSTMWNYASNAKPRGISTPVIESQQRASNALEEHLPMKSQYSAEDPWLSFDGVLATQAPNIEIARMA